MPKSFKNHSNIVPKVSPKPSSKDGRKKRCKKMLMLMPNGSQRSPQIAPKSSTSEPKSLSWHQEPKKAPKWSPNSNLGDHTEPCEPQGPPKAPKKIPGHPKWSPRSPKMDPKRAPDSQKGDRIYFKVPNKRLPQQAESKKQGGRRCIARRASSIIKYLSETLTK